MSLYEPAEGLGVHAGRQLLQPLGLRDRQEQQRENNTGRADNERDELPCRNLAQQRERYAGVRPKYLQAHPAEKNRTRVAERGAGDHQPHGEPSQPWPDQVGDHREGRRHQAGPPYADEHPCSEELPEVLGQTAGDGRNAPTDDARQQNIAAITAINEPPDRQAGEDKKD